MKNGRMWALAAALAALLAAVTAATAVGSSSSQAGGNPYHLKSPGTLVVGMNLQYKPEMYLDAKGKPAGYDVVLLKALANEMKVKLKIQNLDFNGLIPGLVAKKFDMVSVGLSPTPERRKVVTFSRAYVPYAQILAERASDNIAASISA